MRLCPAALLLAMLSTAPAMAQELSPDVKARLFAPNARVQLASRIVRVPMRGTDRAGNAKCPYFQVYVNGQGPFTFLFDTGAAYTLVSSKVMQAAKPAIVVDRARRDVVRIDRLQIGGVTVKDLWAIHDDDFGVDGIIGFPTLGGLNVLFDFSRRELLVSQGRIPMRRSFALPYESPSNVPTIPVRIGTRIVPILIDTGDDAYGLEVRSTELGDAAVERPAVPGRPVMNGAVKQATSIVTLRDPVVLGPVTARSATIAVNDDLPVGDFGFDALRQFRFQIDPKRRLIEFEPLFRGKEFRLGVAAPKTKSRH
jgi:hypothetical protein